MTKANTVPYGCGFFVEEDNEPIPLVSPVDKILGDAAKVTAEHIRPPKTLPFEQVLNQLLLEASPVLRNPNGFDVYHITISEAEFRVVARYLGPLVEERWEVLACENVCSHKEAA